MRCSLVAVLAVAVFACGETGPREIVPVNVVLVVFDSVRADHVGVYGYDQPTTPRLDALAAEGVLFERAYAASSTPSQSLAALWTGRLPTRGGAIGLSEAIPHAGLDTFPAALRRAGWRTAFFSNRSTRTDRRVTRGFDEFVIDSVPGRMDARRLTDKALAFLDDAAGAPDERPFLLVVDLVDASEPHIASAERRARIDVPPVAETLSLPALRVDRALRAAAPTDPAFHDLVARYDAEIIAVDEALGRLLDGLVARGLDGDTLVVVTSSQGTEFLEHDYVGHSWTLYDEVVRVPLVMAAPGRLDPERIRTPVSLVDVFPTLIEVLGLPRSTVSLDGHSLLARDAATWRAGEREPGVVMELVIPEIGITRAVVVGNEKLITMQRSVEPGRRRAVADAYPQIVSAMASGEIPRPPLWAPPVRSELFGLTADPGELTDLSAMSPERRRRLAAVLARYAEQCERDGLTPGWARPPAETPEPGDLDELRQLGYL